MAPITKMKEDLIKFLVQNPNPSDGDVHTWAKENKYDVEEVESKLYQLATQFALFMSDGRANKEGYTEKDADPKELAMGIEIEYEHTPDTDVAKRIALDHLAESDKYYTALKEMEEKLEVKSAGQRSKNMNKMAKFTEELDRIAEEIQAEEPLVALAIDKISDHLEGRTAAGRYIHLFYDEGEDQVALIVTDKRTMTTSAIPADVTVSEGTGRVPNAMSLVNKIKGIAKKNDIPVDKLKSMWTAEDKQTGAQIVFLTAGSKPSAAKLRKMKHVDVVTALAKAVEETSPEEEK